MTHSYAWTWLIRMCRHDSFMCVNMTHSYVCKHDAFICVDMAHSYVSIWLIYVCKHDALICVDLTHSQKDLAHITVTHCIALQHTATHCNIFLTLQHIATNCSVYTCGLDSCTRRPAQQHYKILQHSATQCNTLQHTATHCNTLHMCAYDSFNRNSAWSIWELDWTWTRELTLQHTATHCITLQHTATHCNRLRHTATHCKPLKNTAKHTNSNTLQHNATHSNILQHTATHCNTCPISLRTSSNVNRRAHTICPRAKQALKPMNPSTSSHNRPAYTYINI